MAAGRRQAQIERQRRQARWLGAMGFTVAAGMPVALFHDVVAVLAEQPKLDVRYVSGWAPWILLVLGLAFLLPVAWSAGMHPEHRLFPRGRAAYAGWGVTLYLLGFLLAWQVHEIQSSVLRY